MLQPADVNYGHDQRPQPQPQPAGASQDSGSDAEKALNCHGCLLDSQEEEPLFLSASQIAVDDRYACFIHKIDRVFFHPHIETKVPAQAQEMEQCWVISVCRVRHTGIVYLAFLLASGLAIQVVTDPNLQAWAWAAAATGSLGAVTS